MKTPLTSIIGYSDTLRHVKLNDEQKDRALEHTAVREKDLKNFPEKCSRCWGSIRMIQ